MAKDLANVPVWDDKAGIQRLTGRLMSRQLARRARFPSFHCWSLPSSLISGWSSIFSDLRGGKPVSNMIILHITQNYTEYDIFH
ncbi:TPA: hypothetical protein L9L57_005693 [Klebsiella pneumoniae]|nr:hypothetical protein [Klebsiella pneumoniae]